VKGRYQAARSRALCKIGARCQAGDPVLQNYPNGDLGAIFAAADEMLAGNSIVTQGNANLGRDKAKVKCAAALAKGRSGVLKATLGSALGCQRRRDKKGTTFGPIDASCLSTPGGPAQAASRVISRACANATDMGTCGPLPACVTDAATLAGQGLARTTYDARGNGPTCGDGAVGFPEQCDDGNTAAGDGCSAACEHEGRSCGTTVGARVVRVAITTPQPIAGLRLDLDYPQFEAGLVGTEQASVVKNAVTLLQGTAGPVGVVANDRESDLSIAVGGGTGVIATGDLLDVAMDSCVPLTANICNRNQNVFGCCPSGDVSNCFGNPPACTSFDSSTLNQGTPAGCCPADNACTTQVSATSCSVADPVDATGQPVDGVTCTVTITGS
jgi:cysteine-rich repeat protein